MDKENQIMFKPLSGTHPSSIDCQVSQRFHFFQKKGDGGEKVLTVKKNCCCGSILSLTKIHEI